MCGGLVFIVGGVFVGYVLMGVKIEYLVVVLFMVVLGGLLFVKLMMFEIEKL